MGDLKQVIISRLKSAREDANLTQGELADLLGMARSTYTQIETGRNALSVEDLVKLPAILHKPVHYFLGLPGLSGLTSDETDAIEAYRALPDSFKAMAQTTLQAWLRMSPPPEPDPSMSELADVEIIRPDDEQIMDLLKHIIPSRKRQVYDFIRWQLREQYNVISSSGKRVRKEKRQEWQEVVDLIDLMLAIEEATPQERENFLIYLQERYKARRAGYPSETIATISED